MPEFKRWLVFNIGCIECRVSSDVVGCFDHKVDALAAAEKLNATLSWRQGGQNAFEVFDLLAEMDPEYVEALK